MKIKDEAIFALHEHRADHLLAIAAANDADILILGAFGCGAFQNPPEIVAEVYRTILSKYEGQFQEVVFAVYCTPQEMKNYNAFAKVFGGR